MYCDINVLKHVQNVMITLVTFTLRDVYVLYRLRFGTVMLSEATFKDIYWTLRNSPVKWRLGCIMLRFVAVPSR